MLTDEKVMASPGTAFYQISGLSMKDGVIERRGFKADCDTMYQIASISKFVTSLVVARLFEEDVLDYDTDVNTYLSDCDAYKVPVDGVTLRHLLSHTSGSTDYNGYPGSEPQTLFKQDPATTLDTIEGRTGAKPANFTVPIGSAFNYSGAGYQIVQLILEELTGEPLYKLMETLIFKPLGMRRSTGKLLYKGNSRRYKLAKMGWQYHIYPETAAAGVWMSPNDMLILCQDFLAGYNDDQSRLLSRDTIHMLTTPIKEGYGLGIKMDEKNGLLRLGHGGSNYSYLSKMQMFPESGNIKVVMANYKDCSFKSAEKILGL